MPDAKCLMRCLRCKSMLDRSGREPYRYECPNCKQHYFLVMQLVPVDPEEDHLLEEAHADRRQGTR
jgi:phage FluMu protein Com